MMSSGATWFLLDYCYYYHYYYCYYCHLLRLLLYYCDCYYTTTCCCFCCAASAAAFHGGGGGVCPLADKSKVFVHDFFVQTPPAEFSVMCNPVPEAHAQLCP